MRNPTNEENGEPLQKFSHLPCMFAFSLVTDGIQYTVICI